MLNASPGLESAARALAAALMVLGLGCADRAVEVTVVLVSDYVGGVDVGCIRTSFPDEASFVERCFDEPTPLTSEEVARHSLRPSSIARKLELEATTTRGETLHRQTWVTVVDRRMTVVVSLTSACRDVTCPAGDVCVGDGRCVPERCLTPSGDDCGEPCAGCDALPVADCARVECVAGTCVPSVVEGACDGASYCDYDVGCAPWRAIPSVHDGVGSTCVLHVDGRVACVGNNATAIFGDGTRASSDVPVWSLADDVVSLGCGDRHCCAVHVGGRASCWGTNYVGQMGNGRAGAVYYTSPQRLGLSGIVDVAEGQGFSSHAVVEGSLYRWGGSVLIEDGETSKSNDPVRVEGLPPVRAFSGTAAPCALTTDGGVWCWGRVLGEADLVASPQRMSLDGVRALVGYDGPRCAILDAGEILCWGETADLERTPRPIDPPSVVVDDAVICGADLCVRGEGQITCRALQLATAPWRSAPLPTEGGFGCLRGAICTLDAEGELACWDGETVSRRSMRPAL